MDERKLRILLAIAESFIQTASPIGSKTILGRYQFTVSPATIRNEMAELESEEFIFQPHTSAGRIPTAKGYRLLFDIFKESAEEKQQSVQEEMEKKHALQVRRTKIEKLYDAVDILADATGNLGFATTPQSNQTIFRGMGHFLRQPEFFKNPAISSQAIEILEKNLAKFLQKMRTDENISVFIGEENMVSQLQSCTLMATQFQNDQNEVGYIGILGPTRMHYAHNYSVLKSLKQIIES